MNEHLCSNYIHWFVIFYINSTINPFESKSQYQLKKLDADFSVGCDQAEAWAVSRPFVDILCPSWAHVGGHSASLPSPTLSPGGVRRCIFQASSEAPSRGVKGYHSLGAHSPLEQRPPLPWGPLEPC